MGAAVKLDELVKLEDSMQVRRGDPVYEVVRYGQGEKDFKLKEHRVVSVERAACVVAKEDGLHTKIAFRLLMCKPGERPSAPPPPSAAPAPLALVEPFAAIEAASVPPPPSDDPLDTWLEMGLGLLDEYASKRRVAEARRQTAEAVLDAELEQRSADVAQAERALDAARKAHAHALERGQAALAEVDLELAALAKKEENMRRVLDSAQVRG